MQVTQRVTRLAGPVDHDRAESVLDGRLETALTAIVDVDNIRERSQNSRQTCEALDACARPGLVERCLQCLDPGLERVRAIRRRARAQLALASMCLGGLFRRHKSFVLGPEPLVGDLGRLQLRRQLRQAQLILGAHAIETG